MNELLTPKEVANKLKVSYRKVLDMIALGELPAFKIGGTFRISESELLRYLDSVKVDSSFWKNHTRIT